MNVRKTAETSCTLKSTVNSVFCFVGLQHFKLNKLNSQIKVNEQEQQKMSARPRNKCCAVKKRLLARRNPANI